jgi:hypothetical protein
MNPVPSSSSPVALPCERGALLLMEPPAGWAMAPPVPPARLYLLDPDASGEVRPGINVVVHDLGQLSPAEYLTLSRLQLKGLGANAVVEVDQPLDDRGGGHLFEAVLQAGPWALRGRQLILLHQGTAYVVTAMAPADQFEAYRPRLEKALESVLIRIGSGS